MAPTTRIWALGNVRQGDKAEQAETGVMGLSPHGQGFQGWPGTDLECLLGNTVLHTLQHVHVRVWTNIKENTEQKELGGPAPRHGGRCGDACPGARANSCQARAP